MLDPRVEHQRLRDCERQLRVLRQQADRLVAPRHWAIVRWWLRRPWGAALPFPDEIPSARRWQLYCSAVARRTALVLQAMWARICRVPGAFWDWLCSLW